LMGLAERTGELAGWGPVIADIARQITDQRANAGKDSGTGGKDEMVWRFSITDPLTGALLHHGTTRPPAKPAKRQRERDPRRFPTKKQREFIIARDRTCCGPGCRVHARRAEIDHRIEHADGGPTQVWNMDAKCGFCHDLKDGGWTVTRNAYEDTTWTSLLGHRYYVPATPITPPRQLSVLEEIFLKTARRRM
jgi:hypothetical protein